jgi:hypothetical protein
MAGNLGSQKCIHCRKIYVGKSNDPIVRNHLVHSSFMTTPSGVTGTQFFDEREDRPELFLKRSLKFFRLLA